MDGNEMNRLRSSSLDVVSTVDTGNNATKRQKRNTWPADAKQTAIFASSDKVMQSAEKSSVAPLCLAAWLGDTMLVEFLLQCNGNDNPDVLSPEGYTPLCLAAVAGHLDSVQLLIDSGSNVNYVTPCGNNPIGLAIRKGNIDIVRLLVESGANVDCVDRWGLPLISFAVLHGTPEISDLLLQSGALVNHAESKNVLEPSCTSTWKPVTWISPLCVAASKGCHKSLVSLLNAGADPSFHSAGYSPLYLAARGGHMDTIVSLVDAGADVNGLSVHQQSPLSAALVGKHKAAALFLISKGADCSLLTSSSPKDLICLSLWQAEALQAAEQEKDKLVFGIGHMLVSAVSHHK